MSVTAGVSDTIIAIRDKLRGKIGQTKVKKYWPGEAPSGQMPSMKIMILGWQGKLPLRKLFQVKKIQILAGRMILGSAIWLRVGLIIVTRSELIIDAFDKPEIVSTEEEENKRQEGLDVEEEDEEAWEDWRRRIKEKLIQREQEEAALLPEEEEEEAVEEEEEEESEYETDSEEEQMGIAMVKPVFVPESERDTIAERERLEAEEQALEELAKKKLEERKVETADTS